MKFKLLLLLVLMVPLSYASQTQPFETNLPIVCGDTDNLLKGLRERYQEEMIFMGPGVNVDGDELFHSLWINIETKTWSFIIVNKQKEITCVIASGDQLKMFGPPMI